MKVLILSCNIGGGHNSAARAVSERLEKQNIECEIVDALSFLSRRLSKKISNTYVFITTKIPRAFGHIYSAGSRMSLSRHKSFVYYINKVYRKKIANYIRQNEFDAVVVTHIFPAQTVTALKYDGKLNNIITVAVATDYTCVPFWGETALDCYTIPHPDLTEEYVKRGVDSDKIKIRGIPVSHAFSEHLEKSQARHKYNLPEDGNIYLIMSGSMGFGNIVPLSDALLARDKSAYILIMGGNNTKMKRFLREHYSDNTRVRILDFTNKVSEYMSAADVLFTKPGGLTSTEAVVLNIPVVLTDPIPGCETKNLKFFVDKGMAYSAVSTEQAVEKALSLAQDSKLRSAMLSRQRENTNKHTADDIVNYIKYSEIY